MESLLSMKRKDVFTQPLVQPLIVNDSRFGLRKLFLTTNESPKIAGYAKPGRGPNGESSN